MVQKVEKALKALKECLKDQHHNYERPLSTLFKSSSHCPKLPMRWDLYLKQLTRRMHAYLHFGSLANILAELAIKREVAHQHNIPLSLRYA